MSLVSVVVTARPVKLIAVSAVRRERMLKAVPETTHIRVGVVGLGKMGLLHAGILNTLKESRLIAVCDSNQTLLRLFCQIAPNVRGYGRLSDMIRKERLDVVIVATPVFLHEPMIQLAASAGVSVLVEKPLAMNGLQCNRLLAIDNRKNMVAYCRRFMPTYRRLKGIIESGQFGEVDGFRSHLLVSQVHGKQNGWQYDPSKSGGGVVMDLGCHAFDLFHYLFGKIEAVRASGESRFVDGIEDCASVMMDFTDALSGTLEVSWMAEGYRLPELLIEVQMDKGTIKATEKYVQIDSCAATSEFRQGQTVISKQQLHSEVQLNIAGPEYTLEDSHLLECIINKSEPLCNFRESAAANFVIDAVYHSMSTGCEAQVHQPEP